ncbi:unnamed protein product [Didymodactylos carnosus]|uniref:VASt domain-containing protein n=1 Tax=Didymodactylos carnosus TaxID=1234261 RepID=A0A813P8N4_9BILA|nr:unnamed protein product [Didymodactylos carnosus]CAF0765512.1 unnamed protein product [Didymodactylos carnosus]CAF3523913.1 unnamed protein product [Didymodactylos carnosus]CAF3545588.1 unnamed protein product [Didymodactylos carnosus]
MSLCCHANHDPSCPDVPVPPEIFSNVLQDTTKCKTKKGKKKKRVAPLAINRRTNSSESDEEDNGIPSPPPVNNCYLAKCPCETHLHKQLVERNYQLSVEKLFDLIFGDNEFVRTYRSAQRIYDDHATEWTINPQSQNRERVVTSKIPFVSVLGNSTISSTEKQVIRNEKKYSYYIVDNDIYNTGVKFGDTFYVALRYCLVQTAVNHSNLRITAEVRYLKTVIGFMKNLIEKNAIAAIQVSLQDLSIIDSI